MEFFEHPIGRLFGFLFLFGIVGFLWIVFGKEKVRTGSADDRGKETEIYESNESCCAEVPSSMAVVAYIAITAVIMIFALISLALYYALR